MEAGLPSICSALGGLIFDEERGTDACYEEVMNYLACLSTGVLSQQDGGNGFFFVYALFFPFQTCSRGIS